MDSLKVMIIGTTSSGKSSLINSFVGAFISCVSLNRETFNPIIFNLNIEGTLKNAWHTSLQLKNKHEENQKSREEYEKLIEKTSEFNSKIIKLDETLLEIKLPNIFNKNMELYDCAGLADSNDNNIFEKVATDLIGKMDVCFFVVDASRAFIDRNEVEELNKIKKIINDNKKILCQYTYLGIIINKYDDVNDEEIKEIYSKIKNKIGNDIDVFRYSAHCVISQGMIKNGIFVPDFMKKEMTKILKNSSIKITKKLTDRITNKTKPIKAKYFGYNTLIFDELYGDWDNLVGFIDSIYKTINKKREEIILEKIKEILDYDDELENPEIICVHSKKNILLCDPNKDHESICKYSQKKNCDGNIEHKILCEYSGKFAILNSKHTGKKNTWYCFSDTDHELKDCRLHYFRNNNKKLFDNDGKGYTFKCNATKIFFNDFIQHTNCYEHCKYKNIECIYEKKLCEKYVKNEIDGDTEDEEEFEEDIEEDSEDSNDKVTVNGKELIAILEENIDEQCGTNIKKILEKKQKLIDSKINLDSYHKLIKEYIATPFQYNYLFDNYKLWQSEKIEYLECFVKKSFKIIYGYFSGHIEENKYLIKKYVLLTFRSIFMSQLEICDVDKLLALEEIYNWKIKIKHNDETIDISSESIWKLEELFPCRKELIKISKMNVIQLHVLYHKNMFEDLDDIFKVRIKLFVDKNINDDLASLKNKLFNNRIISKEDYNSIISGEYEN